ncbi:MAG: hypothetical protein AAF564_25975 [Bacteroidota bacterium]
MSFNWQNYVLIANQLSQMTGGNLDDEALLRCAISRYYYSVIIPSRDLISQKTGNSWHKKSTHKWTTDELNGYNDKSSNRAARKAAGILKKMKRKRNMADYDSVYSGGISDLRKDASEMANNAIKVTRLLQQIQ